MKNVPTGAIKCVDDNGNIYYATQVINASFKTVITEYRYYLSQDGIMLPNRIVNQFKINPVVYSDNLKEDVLYLYSKGIIAFDRLSRMLCTLSKNRLDIKPSTIVDWVFDYAETHKCDKELRLQELLNNPILHVDETGFRVNGKNCWIHILTDGDKKYYQMTEKRSDFLDVIRNYRGILIHDHFKPYYQLNCAHAECNAHIERYLKAGIDFYNNTSCAKTLNLLQLALHEKHELLKSGITTMPPDRIAYIEESYDEIINAELIKFKLDNPNIKKKYIPEYIKLFQRMKEYKKEHLMFLYDFNVPYTNNNAERALRMIKTRKKVSGQVVSIERGNQLLSLL